MNTNYKTVRVAVKGSTLYDQYALQGHNRNYYSSWQVRVKMRDGQIEKICEVKLLETYATPTKKQLENAEKLFNNEF